MKILKNLIVVFLLTGMTGAVFAQQPDRLKKRAHMVKAHFDHKKDKVFPQLPDLSEQQKEQIKKIMLETRQQVMPLQNQLREKRARLKTLRTAGEADMNAINKVVEEIGDIRTDIMKQRLASEQELRALLTKQQRVIYDSRRMRGKNRSFRSHFRRGGPVRN